MYNIIVTEAYRSGHNGTDSKSVVPHGTVGSNPTVSASTEVRAHMPSLCDRDGFLFEMIIFSSDYCHIKEFVVKYIL